MKKVLLLIGLIFFVILTSVLIQKFAEIIEVKKSQEEVKKSQELCELGEGAWIEFPNGGEFCHDECNKPEKVICNKFMSVGCDCGQNKCWNGIFCISE